MISKLLEFSLMISWFKFPIYIS